MIYTHSILGGYACMRGSYVYHIPMLASMLYFIQIPDENDLKLAYAQEYREAFLWYWFTAFLHGLLAILDVIITHYVMFYRIEGQKRQLLTFLRKTLRFAQLANYMIMMTLYVTGETAG